MSTRWKLMSKVTPSGRRLFLCGLCGRESIAPDKTCPDGCTEPPSTRSWVIDSGPGHEPRASGCTCQWEIGDSPCTVHPTCERCGEMFGVHSIDCPLGHGAEL